MHQYVAYVPLQPTYVVFALACAGTKLCICTTDGVLHIDSESSWKTLFSSKQPEIKQDLSEYVVVPQFYFPSTEFLSHLCSRQPAIKALYAQHKVGTLVVMQHNAVYSAEHQQVTYITHFATVTAVNQQWGLLLKTVTVSVHLLNGSMLRNLCMMFLSDAEYQALVENFFQIKTAHASVMATLSAVAQCNSRPPPQSVVVNNGQ